MQAKRKRIVRKAVLIFLLIMLLACASAPVWYTLAALALVRGQGVYQTPQAGVIARANQYYCGVEKVVIDQAATNSFDGSNPHVWYVIYTVCAKNRTPCDPAHPGAPLYHQTFERGGNFYLNVRGGWVMVPEGMFPEFIGFWMKVLGQAGPGDSTHVQ